MSTGEKIFWSFIILFLSVIMAFLPVASASYAFKTDSRTDNFVVITAVGQTTGNVTLQKILYDNDTSTIDILSETSADDPYFSSYNTTTRQLLFTGLSENLTREVEITYDVTATGVTGPIATVIDNFSTPVWIFFAILFPLMGFTALFVLSRRN